MSQTKLTSANGIDFATRIDGAYDAPWLILSNSLGSNMSMWNPQIEELKQHYRVLRYDTRGHGGSGVPKGPYDFKQFTGDIVALMDAFEISNADFLGLSLGGMTGLGLAIECPERINRLIVADARSDAPEEYQKIWDTRISTIRDGGLEAIVDATIEMWVSSESRNSNHALSNEIRTMVLATDLSGYIATCQALKKLNFLPKLPKIQCPVLYVGGSDDAAASPEVMEHMSQQTPSSAHVTIEGARHLANLDKPELFNEIILTFLNADI